MKTVRLKLTGTRPLLMHNGQLADPTNTHTKEIKTITSKRGKTEADFEELRKLEWLGSLYLDEHGRPCITEDMILGALISGARKTKKGKQAESAVLCEAPSYAINHAGPSDLLEMFEAGKFCDYRGVVIGQSRVMRARPRFDVWSAEVALCVDEETINVGEVLDAMSTAGRLIGMGDFRPRFGRFDSVAL
jgi:hypothetical protein